MITMDKDSNNKTYSMTECKANLSYLSILSEDEKLTSSLLLSVIILIGSFANPIMVVCLYRIWSTNRSMCRHLLHLAIGDMIRIFLCLPVRVLVYFEIVTFEGKYRLLFQIRMFLDIFTEILQLLILLLISSDRYFAVAKPFKKYNEQKINSVCVLVCCWVTAILIATCSLYYYEEYLRVIEICEIKPPVYALMLSILLFEMSTVVGIVQFYLRTIYILCKQKKKMQTLRQQKVHPEVKEKHDEIPTKSATKENKVTITKAIHNRVEDVAVIDLDHIDKAKNTQTERQTKFKPDANLSTGLSNSANILQNSVVLVPSNLSTDINESATNCKLQKEKLGTSDTDFKNRKEKENTQTDTANDSTNKLQENSQEIGGTQRLDIVINCTFDGIATTKTEVVDGQNSSVVDPNKEQPSFRQADKIGEPKLKTAGRNLEASVVDGSTEIERIHKDSYLNDGDSAHGPKETEKLFVISQQVEFTVKSVSTVSVDLKEDINKQSSSYFKDKTESALQPKKNCVIIQTDDNKEEPIKTDNLQTHGTEDSAQTNTHDQYENKEIWSIERDIKGMNTGAKCPHNDLPLTANTDTSLKKVKQPLQMTTEEGAVISVVGPYCPMPKKSKLKQRYRKEAQVTRNIAIFIVILIFCWMPLYATRFLQISRWRSDNCCFYKNYDIIWWQSLAASTSAFNPCLYGVLNVQLRNEFRRLMKHSRNLLMNTRCRR